MSNESRAGSLPVSLSAALLLGAGWVGSRVTGFGKVAREMLLRGGGTVG